jgi:hypothetical protein
LGVVLWQLWVREAQPPFHGTSPHALVRKVSERSTC